MLITFLGTSAANAYPIAFCSCHNCVEARSLGGTSLRRRSSALVNDDLLIDLGPDIMTASQIHQRPLTNVRYCLQTHPHADHFDPSHILSRSPGFGVLNAPRLHFYASAGTLRQAARLLERHCEPGTLLDPEVGDELNLQIHPIDVVQPVAVGSYRVIAFPADHDPEVGSLLFSVESAGRCMFYGTDTATLPEEIWQAFHQQGVKFDVVILDHTYGPGEEGSDHLGAWQVSECVVRMREEGLVTEHARFFATHISHEGNPVHPKLSRFAEAHGYEVAYDGLTV